MTENTSWLKKTDAVTLLRPMHVKQVDVNSTLTLQSGDRDALPKHQKRKSCLMFRERKILTQVPSEKKSRPSIHPPTTGFRNRTLKMVDNRAIPVLARRSQIGQRRPEPKTQSTPIHMSTPCDVPRSILRHKRQQEQPLSAKKVIFDVGAVEDGVFPLHESTIQDFTQYDIRKPVILRADASTNTEPYDVEIESKPNDAMLAILKEMSNKMDQLLERNNCNCQTPVFRSNPFKSVSQFMTQLDDIQEVSENVTPSTQDASENTAPSTSLPDENVTPTLKGTVPVPVKQATVPDQPQTENNLDTHSEGTVGSTVESVESTIPEKDVPQFRCTRRSATNFVNSPQPNSRNLRQLRKRGLPRHFDSFELSPKAKPKTKISKHN